MSHPDTSTLAGPDDGLRDRSLQLLMWLFMSTLFTSALLMFWVQPLLTKMALPLLGGSPSVWNTAMVFFQATLLCGYGYAHLISQRLALRPQIYLHLTIVIMALFVLPIALRGRYDPDHDPILGLLGLLALSVGLPFFAISATAPLLQRWFSRTGHENAADPYFLYSASNLGSILALLAFPLALEPLMTLGQQSLAWTATYVTFLCLIACCGFSVVRRPADRMPGPAPPSEGGDCAGPPVTWRQRGLWIALAFAPSSLLLGVTHHISMDIAAVPLFWVIPLALYLLTYVITFARRPALPHGAVITAQPYVLVAMLLALLYQKTDIRFAIGIHLLIFFLLALSCHGELVRRRPDARSLTDFYLSMSLGGVLGGMFNVLAAPLLFAGIYEYALAIVVACLLRPGPWLGNGRDRLLDLALPFLLFLIAVFVARKEVLQTLPIGLPLAVILLFVGLGLVVFGFKNRPLRYGLGVAATLLAYSTVISSRPALEQARSFFGVYRVEVDAEAHAHTLLHGTTLHGAQQIDEAIRREPVTYYTREGPLGQAFAALRRDPRRRRVGLVGLGVGSTLCYAREGERWTVFELDPLMVEFAKDGRYFRYWADCYQPASFELLLGDARLRMNEVANDAFDVLLLDAYSSDAVPVHLLTREALALYLDKLAPGGVLLFHISSVHVRLEEVLGALVSDVGVAAIWQLYDPDEGALPMARKSVWAAVAEDEASLAPIRASGPWQDLDGGSLIPWTDDYSNIVSVLK